MFIGYPVSVAEMVFHPGFRRIKRNRNKIALARTCDAADLGIIIETTKKKGENLSVTPKSEDYAKRLSTYGAQERPIYSTFGKTVCKAKNL